MLIPLVHSRLGESISCSDLASPAVCIIAYQIAIGIDDSLEVAAHAAGETPLGERLIDHVLVKLGDEGLRERDERQPCLLGGTPRCRGGAAATDGTWRSTGAG